eukprot:TRINITY_DN96512_c0_g1_i1.p1 TRINITY_DN96512_c0_g1~~TRINITY_DN96512_c0_g1_i1.p1  ORF type:complete len:543 (+),score=84.63 TRINITY_DN96512_c0_g1_i1:62-1690(+)
MHERKGLKFLLDLSKRRYGIALSWDHFCPVDLDLQALIVDQRGHIVDAVYYNNLSALRGALQHSGDELEGDKTGLNEMIWAVLARFPDPVKLVIFVVSAAGDSTLSDAKDGTVHVIQESHGQTVTRFKLQKTAADVDVVAVMEKGDDKKWRLFQVSELADSGEHFLDILEPTIGDIIRRCIDSAPAEQRVTFLMKKGGILDIPTSSLKRLHFCIEGSIKDGVNKAIELDIAAICTDDNASKWGTCHYDHPALFGLMHSGYRDCDEDLSIDLLQVPKKVTQIFLVVNLSQNVDFSHLADSACTVTDQNCNVVASFTLGNENSKHSGLIMCRLARGKEKWWELEAMGQYCPGPTWREALSTVDSIACPDDTADSEPLPPACRRRIRRHTTKDSFVRVVSACDDFTDSICSTTSMTEVLSDAVQQPVMSDLEMMQVLDRTEMKSGEFEEPIERRDRRASTLNIQPRCHTDEFPRFISHPDESLALPKPSKMLARRRRMASKSKERPSTSLALIDDSRVVEEGESQPETVAACGLACCHRRWLMSI